MRTSKAKEGKSFSTLSLGAFIIETKVGMSRCCNASRDGPMESSRNKSWHREDIRGFALREGEEEKVDYGPTDSMNGRCDERTNAASYI